MQVDLIHKFGGRERQSGDATLRRPHSFYAIWINVLPATGGEPVDFHNLTLGQPTDVSADRRCQSVWKTPIEELRKLSALDSDETMPTLASDCTLQA